MFQKRMETLHFEDAMRWCVILLEKQRHKELLKKYPWEAETLWGVSTEQPVDTGYELWKELQEAIANSAGEDQIKIALSGGDNVKLTLLGMIPWQTSNFTGE